MKEHKIFFSSIRFSILIGISFVLNGCGADCSFFNRLFSEPSCTSLSLVATKTPLPLNAACTGAVNSRKVRVNCLPGAGGNHQCTSVSNQATVTSVIMPNNANGNFLDANGKTYTSCSQLFLDLNSGVKVQSISGVFVSSAIGPNSLSCTDENGCVLGGTNESCMSAWDATNGAPDASHTASLPGGNANSYLVCLVIDNGGPPPLVYGSWTQSIPQLTITTNNLHFSTGWTDAYSFSP